MKKKFSFLSKFTFICVFCFIAFLIIYQHINNNQLKDDLSALESERDAYLETINYLTAKISEEELDPELVRSIAKEKLNFREEGVIIFANNLPN